MTLELQRESGTGLPSQLEDIIQTRIKSGVYSPGSRLSSIRHLAGEFGVSNNTVIEALKALESKRMVRRIPARGIFVTDAAIDSISMTNIVFVFPERSLSAELLHSEDTWGIAIEIFRGLLAGGQEYQARIHYVHCDEHESLDRQLRNIDIAGRPDGAVFVGDQLSGLKQYLADAGVPVVTIGGLANLPGCLRLCNDVRANMELLAGHLSGAGFRSFGMLRVVDGTEDDRLKQDCFVAAASRQGMVFNSEWDIPLRPFPKGDSYLELTELFDFSAKNKAEVFFCERCSFGSAFFRLLHEHNIVIGNELGVCGYASIHGYRNFHPAMSFLALPHYEMGVRAAAIISATRAGEIFPTGDMSIAGRLIVGGSTRNGAGSIFKP
ncbi:MAG: GntR family transcriptional regulator [Victivallales bacterium]|nr:GntR family transcriptional regulator [Victivallales bacterium]